MIPIEPDDAHTHPIRLRVLLLLHMPRCAREVRERIPGSKRKQIETTMHRLRDQGLIVCVTPKLLQSRLYARTALADQLVWRLSGVQPSRSHTLNQAELNLRSWICAGRYRRLVLRVMDEPMTPKQIRRRVLPLYQRISPNHVHGVLREFAARSIAQGDPWRHWRLTPLGRRLHDVETDGLPAMPRQSSWQTNWGRR